MPGSVLLSGLDLAGVGIGFGLCYCHAGIDLAGVAIDLGYCQGWIWQV